MLASAGVQSIKLSPKIPNLNAYAERFIRSIKHECLDRIIPIGEKHLWRERLMRMSSITTMIGPIRMGSMVLDPSFSPTEPHGKIICDEQLGKLIRSYRRAAA